MFEFEAAFGVLCFVILLFFIGSFVWDNEK